MQSNVQNAVTDPAATSCTLTRSFGGMGGDPFTRRPIDEVGLRGSKYVDQITINTHPHGDYGGDSVGSMSLGVDEYISEVTVCSGDLIDYFELVTNKGNRLRAGTPNPGFQQLSGICVLAIGGRAGKYVDGLDIMYVRNYQPSTVVESNAKFVLRYTAPGTKMTQYTESSTKTVDAFESVTTSMLNQKYSASVEGEYYVKATASTALEIERTDTETIKHELVRELKTATTTEIEIGQGQVGLLMVQGTIMRGADGTHWMYPTSLPNYPVISTSDLSAVLGCYDLTGTLAVQMSGLQDGHASDRYGYRYYSGTAR